MRGGRKNSSAPIGRISNGVFRLAQIFAMLSPLAVVMACIPGGAGVHGAQQPTSNSSPVRDNAVNDSVTYSATTPSPAPAPTPAWEARTVTTNAANVVQGHYTVQPGDTLRGIGNLTGAGSEALAQANGLEPPYVIYPGQRLTVPAGLYHTVRAGETGIAIARAYGVSWAETVALNGLEEPYILRLGQKLRLPTTGAAAIARDRPLTPEERAAAFTLDIDDVVTGSQPALADGSRPSAPSGIGSTVASGATLAIPASYNGRFIWPLTGSILTRFGAKGKGQISNGIDIAATQGQPITAAGDGVVSYAGNEIPVFGGLILISHGGGWVTAYGHAESLDVVRGQSVRAGQTIGRAGASGFAERPQLHFEIRKDRQPVDPLKYLPAS